jgi:pimeloyl-ACP methyl ester carboxylesterase
MWRPFAERTGRRRASAEVEIMEDAGHWPWYEKPSVIDRIAPFLTA